MSKNTLLQDNLSIYVILKKNKKMRRIVNLTVLAIISAVIFSSCEVQKTATVKTMDITNTGVIQKPVIVDLEIQQTKIKGTASGRVGKNDVGLEAIKNEAVKNALNASGNADVLIEPNFTITKDFSGTTVEVTGYPAKYKNFRNIEEKDATWLEATNEIHKAKIYDTTQKSDVTIERSKGRKNR